MLGSIANTGAQRYPFFNIGIEQGLVQSQVFKLLQDSAGHLWAATLGGLSCYDGKQFRSYTMRDGLPSNVVSTLCCDKQGNICIGTNRGISIYDGHTFRNFTFTSPDNPKGNAVGQLAPTGDGTLWCLANQTLYKMQQGKIVRVATPQPTEKFSALATIGNDVWAAPIRGCSLTHFHEGTWDSLSLPASAEPQFVYRIYEDGAHRIIIVTLNGLYRYEAGEWRLLLSRTDGKNPLLYSFCEAVDGSYWLGTSSGALRLTENSKQLFNKQNGLSDLIVYDVLRDKENNIWIATNGEGIYRFSGAAFTAVDEHMGLEAPQVSSIAKDANGIVYFGTYDGGLYRYTNGQAKPVSFPGVPVHVPISSLELRANTLWIATQGIGLCQYNTLSGAMAQYRDPRIGATVVQLVQDTSGIWIGNGKSVFLLAHDSLHELRMKTSAESFALIGRDSVLMVTSEGLMLHSNNTARPLHSAADSGQIVCMTTRNRTLWIGTSDNGLFGYQIQTGNTIHITRRDGLRSDFIYNLYAAPDGSVWTGTGYGICHIMPIPPHSKVTFYGRSAGITGMESNKNAVLPLPDGSIWFGTTGGAVLYHPQSAMAATKPVSIQLQGVALFGEPIRDTNWYHGTSAFYGVPQNLKLPYQKNNLSFSFTAISLTGDEKITYRYRLEGLSAPWSEWSPTNMVTFSALPPGHYELLVQCSTDGVNPSAQTLHYPFEIITPFHKTTLFRFLIFLACIILGVGLQYLAARGKRRRLAQLDAVRREEQAKVRQRTAEDFHDEVGNKLTRINILTNVLRSKVGSTPDATRLIDQIQDNAGQLYSGTRDILWSLQPSNDNLYQVMNRIRDFGRDLFGDTDTNFEMADIPFNWKEYRLPMDASRNLIMIFKEALNNILKYAGASRAFVTPQLQDGELIVVLQDNGEGFDKHAARRGQGINNMHTRAGRLGGTLELETAPKQGTRITLRLKIPQSTGVRIGANG